MVVPRLILFFIAAVVAASSHAQLETEFGTMGEEHPDYEDWRFREDVVNLPEYPKQENLIEISIDAAGSPFKYFIDEKSLSIGADDTVRYTIAIESVSGYQNIFFETIRCDSREYKTYAYGTGKKTFYVVPNPQWKRIYQRRGVGTDYRRDLVNAYFCTDVRSTLDMPTILHRVHDPSNIPDDNITH